MQIAARLKFANELRKAREYHWKPLLMSVLGGISGLTVLATLTPDMLPDFMLPYQQLFAKIGKTATVIGMVAGSVLLQTKSKVLPDLPKPGEEPPQ